MIRLTRQQAAALGLADKHPAAGRGRQSQRVDDDGLNQRERRYWNYLSDALLARRLAGAWCHPLKLKLAGRTWYEIDFLAQPHEGRLMVLETKGHLEDDAAVKIKVAARLHPAFAFWLVKREGGLWTYRPVLGRSGIGKPVKEPF